jgi:hypothetical protein
MDNDLASGDEKPDKPSPDTGQDCQARQRGLELRQASGGHTETLCGLVDQARSALAGSGRRYRFRQAVDNLLANSARFSPAGHVSPVQDALPSGEPEKSGKYFFRP